MAVTDMANNFNLGVDEDDIEELLEVAPEELTNELLNLEQEHLAEENAREKETAKEKETPQANSLQRAWQKLLQTSVSSLKSLKTQT